MGPVALTAPRKSMSTPVTKRSASFAGPVRMEAAAPIARPRSTAMAPAETSAAGAVPLRRVPAVRTVRRRSMRNDHAWRVNPARAVFLAIRTQGERPIWIFRKSPAS